MSEGEAFVHLTDVTLRDGLQMESAIVPVESKVELLSKLVRCGYQRIELTSFVHPKWIPQFADSEAFCKAVFNDKKIQGLAEWMAFVPNVRGLDRLLAFPIPWASVFIAASEEFNRRNVNQSIGDTLNELKNVIAKARAAQRKTRVYVSTVFGCPYQGAIDRKSLLQLLKSVAELAPDEIALSDTIGVATPPDVASIVDDFLKFFPAARTALHLHDTYGLAVANAQAAYARGIRQFDGSTGGTGGCPYAKGATGNVATESLGYSFYRQGALREFRWKAIDDALKRLESLGVVAHSHLYELSKKGGGIYGIGE